MAEQEILPLGPDPVTAVTISSAFTAPSWLKLKNADDAKAAVKMALADPVLLSECRTSNAVVQRMAGPMGRDAVYVALQPCLILFGAPNFGEARDGLGTAWIALYQDALAKLPKEALEHAVSEWIANGKPFFPKPAELKKLADAKAGEIGLIAWRCKRIVEDAVKARPLEIPPEERAAVGEQFKDLMAALGAKREVVVETTRLAPTPQAAAERIRAAAEQTQA